MSLIGQVLHFWFEELEPRQWWAKDAALDRAIRERFSAIHGMACRCDLFDWRGGRRGGWGHGNAGRRPGRARGRDLRGGGRGRANEEVSSARV